MYSSSQMATLSDEEVDKVLHPAQLNSSSLLNDVMDVSTSLDEESRKQRQGQFVGEPDDSHPRLTEPERNQLELKDLKGKANDNSIPVIMRRSGSSSCLLKPRSQVSVEDRKQSNRLSVTMINNMQLPSYSTERFYMLSEIEHKGHSTFFLCDFESAADSQSDEMTAPESEVGSESDSPFPESIILYILWKPGMESSPRSLLEKEVLKSVRRLQSLIASYNQNAQVYLVIDTLVLRDSMLDTDCDQRTKTSQYESHVTLVEQIARSISMQLRDDLCGLTIGISNHVRAAPGLDKCMEAICWGSKDRRKSIGDSRSSIGVVTQHPDDLLGLQKDPDAAQGVLQSYTCAEWNGNGDILSFAKRTHTQWCTKNNMIPEEEDHSPKSAPRRRQAPNHFDGGMIADPMTVFVVVFTAIWFLRHVTLTHKEGLKDFLDWLESILDANTISQD